MNFAQNVSHFLARLPRTSPPSGGVYVAVIFSLAHVSIFTVLVSAPMWVRRKVGLTGSSHPKSWRTSKAHVQAGPQASRQGF